MSDPLIKYNGIDLYLVVAGYLNNGRLYLGLEDQDGENEVDITINLDDIPEIGDMVVFLNGDISDDLKIKLRDAGLISNPIQQMPYNYGIYDVVFVNRNKLKEFDEKGYEKYEEYRKKKNISSVKKDKKSKDMER